MKVDPIMVRCPACRNEVPLAELNADDECEICAALRSLRVCMETKGTKHPDLFDRKKQLPPGDRE